MRKKQIMKKLSRNLNVVETFNDFALDTQVMDFDYEDLVDYVKENADVFYWLNIESIWGRCGFIWDTYEKQGHFNNVSIKFNTLPRIPDPERIQTFRGLFSNLDAGTYYINDNDWDNITELGGWGKTGQTFVFDMPSANFSTISTYNYYSKYKPLSSIDSIDWSTLSNTFHLIIDDDNRDIIHIDVDNVFSSYDSYRLYLYLNDTDTQEESIILDNIPDVIPYNKRRYYLNNYGGKFQVTLYRQEIDEEGTLALRSLFFNTDLRFYWPYEDVENPPIMINARTVSNTSHQLFYTYRVDERNFINCKVVPGYKNNVSWEEDVEIPEEYDVFNNPDHKVRYISNTYNTSIGESYTLAYGTAFYLNSVKFEHRLDLRVNTELLKKLNYSPRFTYIGGKSINLIPGYTTSCQKVIDWFEDNDDTACAFSQYTHSTSTYDVVYHTAVVHNSGIEFYNESGTVIIGSKEADLYYRGHSLSNVTVNELMQIIKVADDCELSLNSLSTNILMLQDIYFTSGIVTIPRDTEHKIIFDSASRGMSSCYIIDGVQGQVTIPNVFDFSNIEIKEGYEIQDLVGFDTFRYFLYKEQIIKPEFITVDPTLDFIWQGDIKIVHNTDRGCSELMEKLQAGFIFDYPLSRVKQISTPTKTGNKIHLEGGFVFSLDDEDTVGNSEGIEYFLSKFKFRENPQPRENELYLNPEQYDLFTQEQMNLLTDNGWEIHTVRF